PATTPAVDAARDKLQNNPVSATAQIAHLPLPTVIPTPTDLVAAAASRFFERRSRLTISVPASPSTSRIVARGLKPGYLYASDRCRFGFARSPMPKRARFLDTPEQRKTQYPQASDPL